jgi:hypothetical protein
VTEPVHEERKQAVGLTAPSRVSWLARNGQIVHLRDYVNIHAAAAALGRDI